MRRVWTEMQKEIDHDTMELGYWSEAERSSTAKSNRILKLKWQMTEIGN